MIAIVFILGLIYLSWMHYWILLLAWLVVFAIVGYKYINTD